MIWQGLLSLFLFGQMPHDLDCRGRFELQSRVEPIRIFPGEDLFWTLRIAAQGPWKRGPNRPALSEDPGLNEAFAIQSISQDTPSRFPEGLTGPSGTVWEFTWKLTPLPQRGQPSLYPAAIPEVGFVLTRDDVPWQSLARETIWTGPMPLTYREAKFPLGPEKKIGLDLVLAMGTIIFLFIIIVMLGYEWFWARNRWQKRSRRMRALDGDKVLSLRQEFKCLLREAGLVLPEEPGENTIQSGVIRAGYPVRLSREAMALWNDLNQAAFQRNLPLFEIGSCPTHEDLKRRVLDLATAFQWRFWNRRIVVDPAISDNAPLNHLQGVRFS